MKFRKITYYDFLKIFHQNLDANVFLREVTEGNL